MRNFRIAIAGAALLAAVSCARTAGIKAEIEGLSSADIVVRQQNVNRYDVVDTVKTDEAGRLSIRIPMEKGNPDFVYLYYGDRKIASLLLERGDKVKVTADTLGNYTVYGSPESERLGDVERRYSEFSASVDSLSAALVEAGLSSPEAKDINKEMTSLYLDYYRDCIRYVQANPFSLTVIPVFYQTVANSFYVFSQDTDAFIFEGICDSLSKVYPDSKYVRSLRNETDRRKSAMELNRRIETAESIGFPDISLPDMTGKKVKLSEVDAKVILVHFWTATSAEQKMFNLDVLKGIYADYHRKGLEIYQVAVDVDKPSWERTVTAQGLEWINVCDGLGSASPVLTMYNVSSLPVTYIIADGEMTGERVSDAASLRRVLNRLLK